MVTSIVSGGHTVPFTTVIGGSTIIQTVSRRGGGGSGPGESQSSKSRKSLLTPDTGAGSGGSGMGRGKYSLVFENTFNV